MTRRIVRLVAVLAIFVLVAAACGSDRESSSGDDPTAAPEPTDVPDDGDTSGDDPTGDDTSGDGEDDTPDETPDETPPEEEAAETFGDLEWPCGPGDASGATDQGVTDDSILIGGGDDRGFAAALGLNKAQTDAIQALVEKCNELGGILGRQIEVEPYDAKLFEVSTVMLDACDRMFMLVGEGFAVDGFGEETRVQCDLAHIPAWTVSAAAAHGPGMIQPVPNPADQLPMSMAAYLAETFPDRIADSAALFGNFGATIETKDKVVAAYPALGFEFDEVLEYNVNGEDDWTPFVLTLKDAGTKMVYFTGSCLPNYQAFRAAAAVNDFEAIYTTDANFYESTCAEANADGVMDDTYIRVVFFPFEERDTVKAIDDYMTLLEDWGGDISATAMQTTSAFFLWATAARACGSELTRECVLAEAEAIDEWTGGGLHVPTDPGVNVAPTCGIVLRLEGEGYTRVFPEAEGELACDNAWRADVDTEWVEDANLDENRISQQFTG